MRMKIKKQEGFTELRYMPDIDGFYGFFVATSDALFGYSAARNSRKSEYHIEKRSIYFI